MSNANKFTWFMIFSLGLYVAYCSYTPSVEMLLGPDIDKNGIRDDVDEWILENTENKYVRLAYQDIARTHRELFNYLDDKEKSFLIIKKYIRAKDCLHGITSYMDREKTKGRWVLSKLQAPLREKARNIRARLVKKGHSYEEAEKIAKSDFDEINRQFAENNRKYGELERKTISVKRKRDHHRRRFYKSLDGHLDRSSVLRKQRNKYFSGTVMVIDMNIQKDCKFKVNMEEL